MAGLDDQIDALYQLPPGEFTAARAQLAKTLKGDSAAAVKALKKPAAVPWAVNRLYWRDRRAYQRLLETGRALRTAQVAAIEGRKADVRTAAAAHRASVTGAAARAVQLAADAGIRTRPEPIAQMLEAVSLAPTAPEHPGRFTDVLHPAAFEALAGVVPHRARGSDAAAAHARERGAGSPPKPREHDAREERRREQERRARRGELEAAVAKADHAADRAREHTERAREDVERARRTLAKAEESARQADAALEAARAELETFDSADR